jgi:phosphatidylethanolamine-binding protein (PEBP) family uncharacterized protein
MSVTIRSPAFGDGQPIPKPFTGDGEDISPSLTWSGVPAAAKEQALVCDDPDAPTPHPVDGRPIAQPPSRAWV